MEYIPHCRCWHQLHSLAVAPLLLCDLWMKPCTVESCDTVYVQTIGTGNNTVEHDMDSKPCQEWRLQPQPWATDVLPQHDLGKRLTVEQCLLPANGGGTETSGAAVNELSQKWDYTFTSREPHILSPGVDIDRSGEESLDCLHISSLSSIVELCSSLGIEKRIIRTVTSKIVLGINLLQKVVHYDSHCRLQYSSVGPDCDRAGQLLVCPYSCLWGSP